MRLGYARVSTGDQTTALQVDALKAASCDKVYQDKSFSGIAVKRPQLARCMKALQAGDVLVVWKLDRLGRSLGNLIDMIEDLRKREIGFCSVSEAIDTTTPQGKLVFHIMGALAEFERSLIAERTSAGRKAAKKRGVRFGRPRSLTAQQVEHGKKLAAEGKRMVEIAGLLGVSRASAYRLLAEAN